MMDTSDIREEELHPTYKAVAKVIGIEAALRLGKELGGESFYLPSLDKSLARFRERKILDELVRSDWNDSPVSLARKYGVSSRYVQILISTHRPPVAAANG